METELKNALTKAIEHLKDKFRTLQVGRANAAMLESVQVEQYGTKGPLKSAANVSVPDAQTLRVEPWDKSLVGAIEKAIHQADLGFNPNNMGEYILISIPPLTEERRKKLAKVVHSEVENAKVVIRNIRKDFFKQLKTQKDNKEISDDEYTKQEKSLQVVIDEKNKVLEQVGKDKEKDIMTI
jgi:ribosome recycling factor